MQQNISQPDSIKINPKPPLITSKILNYILSIALVALLLVFGVVLTFQYIQIRKIQTLLEQESAKTVFQKTQKDQIRDIWEDQARINDELVKAQIDLSKAMIDYQTTITQNIFINKQTSKFEIAPTADTIKVVQAQQRVFDALNTVELKLNDNAKKKQEYTNKVNELYKQASEAQTRRTNSN